MRTASFTAGVLALAVPDITHVAGRSVIDIDHVVSLSDAWQKGEGDAATWLPPNKAYRCSFVARVLGTCPAHPLPR